MHESVATLNLERGLRETRKFAPGESRGRGQARVGWITGHSFVVYGPMQLGATQILYEGAPNWPEPDRMWQIVATEGVSILYTAPRPFVRS